MEASQWRCRCARVIVQSAVVWHSPHDPMSRIVWQHDEAGKLESRLRVHDARRAGT
jgi:hypothetical protein